jgi:hypothetical protein
MPAVAANVTDTTASQADHMNSALRMERRTGWRRLSRHARAPRPSAAGNSHMISGPRSTRPIRAMLVAPNPPVVAVVPALLVIRPMPL